MAHIPQHMAFVNPREPWGPSEDGVIDEAVEMLAWYGECPCCAWEVPEASAIEEEQARTRHALACQPLRDRATARLVREREDA